MPPGLGSVRACPLCGESRTDAASHPQPNLYSEQLALLLGCDEAILLSEVRNRRCSACGLWYKTRWFAADTLATVFRQCVPDHPKGWDAISGRFSEAGYRDAVADLRAARAAGDVLGLARARRVLGSIVDSVQAQSDHDLIPALHSALADCDIEALLAMLPQLRPLFANPAPFKRFSGFSSPLLWEWVEHHVGRVRRYGEVGCPLWGQLARPMEPAVDRWYFHRPEPNYWGAGCCRGGVHCSDRLAAASTALAAPWPPCDGAPFDVIGAFQYLDHLTAPNAFAAEVFSVAHALLLILDDGSAPSAIQHATGWGARPIAWLATRHGKRVVDDFAPIAGSGNHAWLLCDA